MIAILLLSYFPKTVFKLERQGWKMQILEGYVFNQIGDPFLHQNDQVYIMFCISYFIFINFNFSWILIQVALFSSLNISLQVSFPFMKLFTVILKETGNVTWYVVVQVFVILNVCLLWNNSLYGIGSKLF